MQLNAVTIFKSTNDKKFLKVATKWPFYPARGCISIIFCKTDGQC